MRSEPASHDRAASDGDTYVAIIILSCFIGIALGFGPIFVGSFSIFIKPLGEEYGWSRSAISAGVSLAGLICAVISPVIGMLADRLGAKRIILIGTLLFALGLAAMGALPHSYALFLMATAFVGMAGAGTTSVLYTAVLSQWSRRRFGLNLGIALTGSGVVAVLVPVSVQWLVDTGGWRSAYFALSLLVCVLAFPNALFLLREKTGGTVTASDPVPELTGCTRKEALATAIFWRVLFAIMFIAMIIAGTSVHLVAFLIDQGLRPSVAATYLSLFGIGAIGGRLIAGVCLDRIRSGLVGVISFSGPVIGIALIAFDFGGPALAIGVLLIGLAYGAEGEILAYVVRQHFGMRSYGVLYGTIFGAFNCGILFGPMLMGGSFDLLGSYTPMLMIFIVIALISAALIEAAGKHLPDDNRAGRKECA